MQDHANGSCSAGGGQGINALVQSFSNLFALQKMTKRHQMAYVQMDKYFSICTIF
jgi:hypothetical protein